MTKQQRKVLLICLAVVVGSFFARSLLSTAVRTVYYRQQPNREPAKPTAFPSGVASPSPAETLPGTTFLPGITGTWVGATVLEGKGLCNLRFELKQTGPGTFSGYSTLSSLSPDFLPRSKDQMTPLSSLYAKLDPISTIFTGTAENGSIQFHADKNVGADEHGCAMTSLTLTPFGAKQLLAEWKEGTCPGGHVLMHKEGH